MATRRLYYNNSYYYFNFSHFKELINIKNTTENKRLYIIEEELADYTNSSKSAVHNWRNEQNGPGSIEIVEKIAEYFNLTKVNSLLTKERNNMLKILSEMQIQSMKRIYDSILCFLNTFYITDGFNNIWLDNLIPKFNENKILEYAENEHNKVKLVLKQEFFYLKNTKVYVDLENYIYNDLYDIYDEKLSYAFRFEAEGKEYGTPTTYEDYCYALDLLNQIISRYT